MQTTYHIRIKKEYAAEVIEDLQKMDAVELIPETIVPDWHIAIVNERLEDYKKDPAKAIDFDAAIDDIEKYL